ncbi:MAG: hypothetical protein HQK51_10270 [Oligoflexia bacterium]|nr:hypothetical protein [Oligoflexia bacterium]
MKVFKIYLLLIYCSLLVVASISSATDSKDKNKKNKKVATKSRSIASVVSAESEGNNNSNSKNTKASSVRVSKSEEEQIELGEVNTIFAKETPCQLRRDLNPKTEFSSYSYEKSSEQGGSNARDI